MSTSTVPAFSSVMFLHFICILALSEVSNSESKGAAVAAGAHPGLNVVEKSRNPSLAARPHNGNWQCLVEVRERDNDLPTAVGTLLKPGDLVLIRGVRADMIQIQLRKNGSAEVVLHNQPNKSMNVVSAESAPARFSRGGFDNDIGLLLLERPFPGLGKSGTVVLATNETEHVDYKNCSVVIWGSAKGALGNEVIPIDTDTVSLESVSNANCNRASSMSSSVCESTPDPDRKLSLYPPVITNGPLMCKQGKQWVQVAVNNQGPWEMVKGKRFEFTRVSGLAKWIKETGEKMRKQRDNENGGI